MATRSVQHDINNTLAKGRAQAMRWQIKLVVQKVLSALPGGEQVNHYLQRKVTRSLPVSDSGFLAIVNRARAHVERVERYLNVPVSTAVFYEFGAGYELVGPLTFYALGIKHQIVIDVRVLARRELVNHAIETFLKLESETGLPGIQRLTLGRESFRADLSRYYGVQYKAPCDARMTGLESQSVDCITSTSTLEHVAPGDIRAILAECHRILKDDGIMSMMIDYKDHYSYFDRRISVYNYLKFPDNVWSHFNPRLHYQNRLRHRDYLALFREAGFEVLEDNHADASEADIGILREFPLAPRFRMYSLSELAIRQSHVLLKKSDRS